MKKLSIGIGIATIVAMFALANQASAVSIDPSYTTFGPLSQATFGGSGIPNTAVAITTLASGNYNVTLGLTAHQRYSNPALANDGAGNFYAMAGDDSAHGEPGYGLWNVGYYVNVDPELYDFNAKGYSVKLFFDANKAIGNNVSTSVAIEPNYINGITFDSQNSWNLGMLAPFSTFDPNEAGEYDFMLALYKNGTELGKSAITVHVNGTGQIPGAVPDGGATVTLLGCAFFGIATLRRFSTATL